MTFRTFFDMGFGEGSILPRTRTAIEFDKLFQNATEREHDRRAIQKANWLMIGMWTKNPINAIMARIELRWRVQPLARSTLVRSTRGYIVSQLFNGEFLIINNIFD
jgi:hypothetical protein